MKWRIFISCWLVFSLHFATNVVREHYPAFALIEHGNFQLDEYAGYHSDIFRHRDGHHYVGNQVAGSLVAVPPLLVFDPLLDALEAKEKAALGQSEDSAHYETEYPNRALFFAKLKAAGLTKRFGASAAITSVFCMALIGAFLALLMFSVLKRRGVSEGRSALLSLLFAFGTPVFYRAAHLNHNFFLMATVFGSFLLMRNEAGGLPRASRLAWSGILAGFSLALDYAGVVPLLIFWGWILLRAEGGFWKRIRSGMPYVLGSVPGVLLLVGTQWAMYGHPFWPGQKWMRDVNYTDLGWRGFGWPDPSLFLANLIDLDWGLYSFGPLLVLGLIPAGFLRGRLVLARGERRAVGVFLLGFLLFCAANQYSRMQWNSGFRYLLPLVPFIFLQLADHLARWPRALVLLLGVPAVLHSWVLAMVRYTPPDRIAGAPDQVAAIPGSWSRFLHEGVQFPWLTVLRQTDALHWKMIHWAPLPYAILALLGAVLFVLWRPVLKRCAP